MLHSSPFIVLQISLYLTLPFSPKNRLVHWQQHCLFVISQNNRIQPTLARPNILRREIRKFMKTSELLNVRNSAPEPIPARFQPHGLIS
jgi:hypothetical protein